MKKCIDANRAGLLKYSIRTLAVVADKLSNLGVDIWAWENIGDPVKQGHQVPDWIKEELKKTCDDNANWGYSPTEGLMATRTFIANSRKKQNINLNEKDIIFASGLGHAINTLYQVMSGSKTRTICPSPTYPSHSSMEAFVSGKEPILYNCSPETNWQPDIEDLEEKIKNNHDIGFILLILPNNPTGACYSDDVLLKIADIAKKYSLGIISDETYINVIYKNQTQTSMAEILRREGGFPLIVMRSMSKDIPWPGGRSGWMEFYNYENDENFSELEETVKQMLRMQVCSTTMVQAMIPKIYGDARYLEHLQNFIATTEEQSQYISNELNKLEEIKCIPGQGAFYLAAIFKEGVLKPNQTLPIANPEAKSYIELLIAKDPKMPLDKRFSLYLMASKGIFVTPLTGFEGPLGFRVTTLRTNLEETRKVYTVLGNAIKEYTK